MRDRRIHRTLAAALVLVALLTSLTPSPSFVRVLFGLPLVLVLPGYALSGALFPSGTFEPLERALVSVGLSLVSSVLGALLLNVTSSGLRTTSWALLLSVLSLTALLAAGYRDSLRGERRTPLSSVTYVQLTAGAAAGRRLLRQAMAARPRPGRNLLFAAAVPLLLGAAILVSVDGAHTADRQYRFTQIWFMPGSTSDRVARVGVKNMEGGTIRYRLDLAAGGKAVGPSTSFTLQPGQQWEVTEVVSAPPPGGDRIVATLYREDRPTTAYRQVELSRGG